MRYAKLLAVSLLTAAATGAQAEVADINIGPDSVRLFLAGPLSRVASSFSGQYDLGVIYKKGDRNSPDPTDQQLKLAHVGVLATGDAGAKGTNASAGLGLRAVFADRHGSTGEAVALGGQFDARLPGYQRVGLGGYAWFAPSIISFGNVKNYSEYALDVEFEVVKAASVYAGYRGVNVKPKGGGSADADSSGHIGIRLNF